MVHSARPDQEDHHYTYIVEIMGRVGSKDMPIAIGCSVMKADNIHQG